jgi:hypothetical protein
MRDRADVTKFALQLGRGASDVDSATSPGNSPDSEAARNAGAVANAKCGDFA